MASPRARQLVRAFRRHQKFVPQRRRHLGLRRPVVPGEVRCLVLGIVLKQRKQCADLQVRIRQLVHLPHPVRHQDGVVGDTFKKSGRARVHGEHRGFEPHRAPHVQVLQVRERGHVAGDHFVAHQLQELRDGDLQRGVDLIGGLVLRRAIGLPRSPQVVHGPGEPGIFDRKEPDIGARNRLQRRRQVGHHVAGGQLVEPGDDRGAQWLDGGHGDRVRSSPRIHGRQQRIAVMRRVPGPGQQLGYAFPFGARIGRFRRLAGGGPYAAVVRDRLAHIQDLHGEFPHGFEAQGQAGEVVGARRFGFQSADGAEDVYPFQIGLDRLPVGRLGRDTARCANPCRGWVGVRRRKRLVGEPRIGDETAHPRGAHHVASPQRIDSQNGVAHQFLKTRAHDSASSLLPSDLRQT